MSADTETKHLDDEEAARRRKQQQADFDAKVRRYGCHLISGEVVYDPALLSRNPKPPKE